jgi:hypothetical protein
MWGVTWPPAKQFHGQFVLFAVRFPHLVAFLFNGMKCVKCVLFSLFSQWHIGFILMIWDKTDLLLSFSILLVDYMSKYPLVRTVALLCLILCSAIYWSCDLVFTLLPVHFANSYLLLAQCTSWCDHLYCTFQILHVKFVNIAGACYISLCSSTRRCIFIVIWSMIKLVVVYVYITVVYACYCYMATYHVCEPYAYYWSSSVNVERRNCTQKYVDKSYLSAYVHTSNQVIKHYRNHFSE